jgi:polygalacturonase
VPTSATLGLSKLQQGTTVTFEGKTVSSFHQFLFQILTYWQTFAYTDWDEDLITIGGEDITVIGASGSVIDGNGQAWWDGQGSNGGVTK